MFKERTEKAKEKLIDPDSSDEDSIIPCESVFHLFYRCTVETKLKMMAYKNKFMSGITKGCLVDKVDIQ